MRLERVERERGERPRKTHPTEYMLERPSWDSKAKADWTEAAEAELRGRKREGGQREKKDSKGPRGTHATDAAETDAAEAAATDVAAAEA